MRVLIFNWRDIENPMHGGAEVYTHEISKRWVQEGHTVVLITSNWRSGCSETTLDGVRIVRLSKFPFMFLTAKGYYKRYHKGDYDVVIDEINTRPFFAIDFAVEPVVALIHELARESWFFEIPFPLNLIGFHLLEPHWLKRYVSVPTVVDSASTKKDLLNLGYQRVEIVRPGISVRLPSVPVIKERSPTLLFVGLMKQANRPGDAIEAYRIVKRAIPDARLWMVGDGAILDRLRRTAPESDIRFWGYISEALKAELMRRAHVLVVPAVREGWGMVVSEAAVGGTPAVGYDVPGLRDSIVSGETGILTPKDPRSLAEGILNILRDETFRGDAGKAATSFAEGLSWDRSAREFLGILESVASPS